MELCLVAVSYENKDRLTELKVRISKYINLKFLIDVERLKYAGRFLLESVPFVETFKSIVW